MIPSIRVFFAIEIKKIIRHQITALIDELRQNDDYQSIQWTGPEKLHVTLTFFPQMKMVDIPDLINEVRKELILLSPFYLAFDKLGVFPTQQRPHYIVLEREKEITVLTSLVKTVSAVATRLGYPEDTRLFRCHMTLGKIKHQRAVAWKEHIISVIDPICVNQIVLFQSIPVQGKSTYVALGRIPIGSNVAQ